MSLIDRARRLPQVLVFALLMCCLQTLLCGLRTLHAAEETAEAEKLTAEQTAFFETKIRPLLVQHCYECHSSEATDIEGGLVLDSEVGLGNGRR